MCKSAKVIQKQWKPEFGDFFVSKSLDLTSACQSVTSDLEKKASYLKTIKAVWLPRQDEVQIDMERFCRAVDRAVLEHHSRPSGLPLILATLPEHHHLFHRVSHNPFLMAEGLTINPDVLPIDELRERAWNIVEPQYEAQLAALIDEFALAKSKGLGSDDLAEVAQAAATGRVATLLIEADRQIAGRLDGSTGRVEIADLYDPQVDDQLDDLGEPVVKMGGRVMVIPADQMPTRTGLAATFRY
jgi:hypothetical protein